MISVEDTSMSDTVPEHKENAMVVSGGEGDGDGDDHEDNQPVEDATSDKLTKDQRPEEEPSEITGSCEDPSHIEMAEKLTYYKRKARDSKRMVLRLKCQKDNELQSLTTQLLVLEGHLRREQKEIQSQLMQRDHFVQAQSQEIEKLRRNNRRLINRLKKFSEVFGDKDSENIEPRSKMGRLDSIDEDQYLSTDRSGCISPTERSGCISPTLMLLTSPSNFPFTSPSKSKYPIANTNENKAIPISTLSELNNLSNKYIDNPNSYQPEIINPDILNIRATTDRVFHKPPKVEKVKSSPQNNKLVPNCGDNTTEAQTPNKKACSIVSTISRLLDEESDCTATAGSSNSEPSSPEATVKTVPPRVVRLARKLKESLTSSNLAMRFQNSPTILDTSLESNRQEETYHKSYLSDEHEVTSGYNSDALSDPDYDSLRSSKSKNNSHPAKDKDYDLLTEQDNMNCLDNDSICASQQLAEDLASESLMSVRNVPRSRHNIKFLMDNDSDHMTENFEEFTLDSLESEENHHSERLHPDTNRDKENIHDNPGSNKNGNKDITAKEVDNGSMACLPAIAAVRGDATTITKQYEQMLESSSNIIQKSILTPTRSLINHRSMLKPRDIKHRNKLRTVCTTLASLEESPSSGHKYYVKL